VKVRVRIRVDDSPAVLTLPTHIQGLKSADMVQYGVPALLKKMQKVYRHFEDFGLTWLRWKFLIFMQKSFLLNILGFRGFASCA